MVERKLCSPLPFRIQKLPYETPTPRIPTPAAFTKWLGAITNDGPWDEPSKRNLPGPKKALLWIMVRAGLRFVEATHLRWEDIDFDQGVLYLSKTKGSRHRIAPLPDEARQILEPIIAELKKLKPTTKVSGWIAPNPRTGQPYKNMKTLFRTASARSGVPIKGPHTLRHIHGTYLLAATGDLRLVQTSLGHTQIRTTERYTQIDINRLKLGQAAISQYTAGKENKKPVDKQEDVPRQG